MPRFIVVPPEGEITELTVAENDEAVHKALKDAIGGGWLELVSSTIHPHMYVYIDEEGKFKDFKVNPRATSLIVGLMPGDYIAGTAVLVGGPGPRGEETDCPLTAEDVKDEVARRLTGALR